MNRGGRNTYRTNPFCGASGAACCPSLWPLRRPPVHRWGMSLCPHLPELLQDCKEIPSCVNSHRGSEKLRSVSLLPSADRQHRVPSRRSRQKVFPYPRNFRDDTGDRGSFPGIETRWPRRGHKPARAGGFLPLHRMTASGHPRTGAHRRLPPGLAAKTGRRGCVRRNALFAGHREGHERARCLRGRLQAGRPRRCWGPFTLGRTLGIRCRLHEPPRRPPRTGSFGAEAG